MTWSDPGLILNALIVILLIAVIVFAVLLNRRLKSWRGEAGEIERLIVVFNGSIARAEAALNGLKQTAREDGQSLDVAQKRAHALRDDLAYLVERGGSLADRLELAVRSGLAQQPAEPPPVAARAEAPAPAPAAPAPAAPAPAAAPPRALAAKAEPKNDARPISDAEKRLMAAMETMR